MGKKMISKVYFNKKNGQPLIFPSKKKMKKLDPTIKFNDNLFVKIELIRKNKRI